MKTIYTKLDVALLIARVTVSIVMFTHGAQKLLGWFGGYGIEGTMQFFTETIGLPYILGFAIILCESIGMLFLAAGIFTRLLSISVIIIMMGAIITAHLSYGFFMNWEGQLGGEGFELHILMIGLALIPSLFGGGNLSLQPWIDRKIRNKQINDGMYFI